MTLRSLAGRRIAPFALIAVVGIASIGVPEGRTRFAAWVAALIVVLAVYLTVALTDWRRAGDTRHTFVALQFFVAVALARHAAGGAAGGIGVLAVMPVIWMALYGRRGQLLIVLAGMTLMFAVPLLAVGGPDYPAAGWRSALLLISLAAMIGDTVQRLVATEREQGAILRARESEQEGLLSRLATLAASDPLTGTLNRRSWDSALDEALRGDSTSPICVAMLDLDRFKRLNDREGHQAGDRALLECVAGWTAALRRDDLLARIGGDEFAVLLPGCGVIEAQAIVRRLSAATAAGLTCSVGLALWDTHESAQALQRRADAELYEAKRTAGHQRA